MSWKRYSSSPIQFGGPMILVLLTWIKMITDAWVTQMYWIIKVFHPNAGDYSLILMSLRSTFQWHLHQTTPSMSIFYFSNCLLVVQTWAGFGVLKNFSFPSVLRAYLLLFMLRFLQNYYVTDLSFEWVVFELGILELKFIHSLDDMLTRHPIWSQ